MGENKGVFSHVHHLLHDLSNRRLKTLLHKELGESAAKTNTNKA